MKPQPIQSYNPTFGVYKVTKITHYGHRDTGILRDKKLDIYTGRENGELKHKLYYLSDNLGNWIKSKLVYFENGKKVNVVRSEKR
jgi:hypothetical protein